MDFIELGSLMFETEMDTGGPGWLAEPEDSLFSPVTSDLGELLDLQDEPSMLVLAEGKEEEDKDGGKAESEGTGASEEVPKGWTRHDALERYKLKRKNRSYRKKIRYACRKKIAAERPRSGGRFVKVDESSEVGACLKV